MSVRARFYMPHIDGLRCLAVVAVLLFHFGVPGLGGGYVGVDVFFVISGYLISGIIIDEIARTGRFDFKNFYIRRSLRILPALLAVLAMCTLWAVVSLTPGDLVAYGKSLAASAASLSNLLFWSESGYFDAASKTKPLLHTWSLSVEEQFYLFWPAFIYLCCRAFGRKRLVPCVLLVLGLSFLANHAAVSGGALGYKSDLFFLPHYRVFEFAIGALGCFISRRMPSSRWVHELAVLAGLGMILFSIASLKEGDVFPYVKGLLPCVGALLVILGVRSSAGRVLLANPVSTWIGRTSYSLYLAHWPIVVGVEQSLPTSSWSTKFAWMVVLSLVVAVLLHYAVEVPFRYQSAQQRRRNRVALVVSASLATCALGAMVVHSNGMVWRYKYFTPGVFGMGGVRGQQQDHLAFRPLSAAEIEAGKRRRFSRLGAACNVRVLEDRGRCHLKRPSQVLFFGNSHEPDAFNAFNALYGEDRRVNLITFGTVNDCAIVIDGANFSSPTTALDCDKRFATLNDTGFMETINVVVYNAHMGFDEVSRDLWRVLEVMKRKNPKIKIIAIGSYLQTPTECATLYNRYHTYDACRDPNFENYFKPDERAVSPIPQVRSLDYIYISKYELFCVNSELATCATWAYGEPAFYDQHHLSLGFAEYMGDRILELHKGDLVKAGLPVPSASN